MDRLTIVPVWEQARSDVRDAAVPPTQLERLAELRRAVDAGKARQLSFLPESPVVRRVVVKPARGVHVPKPTAGGAS